MRGDGDVPFPRTYTWSQWWCWGSAISPLGRQTHAVVHPSLAHPLMSSTGHADLKTLTTKPISVPPVGLNSGMRGAAAVLGLALWGGRALAATTAPRVSTLEPAAPSLT